MTTIFTWGRLCASDCIVCIIIPTIIISYIGTSPGIVPLCWRYLVTIHVMILADDAYVFMHGHESCSTCVNLTQLDIK